MTDQDYDGFHIKGLLIIYFIQNGIVYIKRFYNLYETPIIKATKANNELQFYNLSDYDIGKKIMMKQDIKLNIIRDWYIK